MNFAFIYSISCIQEFQTEKMKQMKMVTVCLNKLMWAIWLDFETYCHVVRPVLHKKWELNEIEIKLKTY